MHDHTDEKEKFPSPPTKDQVNMYSIFTYKIKPALYILTHIHAHKQTSEHMQTFVLLLLLCDDDYDDGQW